MYQLFLICIQLGKKGYLQLQTSHGNLNLELHCEMVPMPCWNFITLAERGYYDNTSFHRLIPGFMLQGGKCAVSHTSTSSSDSQDSKVAVDESAWGPNKTFKDLFDSRLLHDSR